MLVLTRKIGEGIAIGDDVKIVVMQIKGKQVRLGIKAAPSLTVHREEIYQKILDENRAASHPETSSVDAAGAVLGTPRSVGHVLIKKHVTKGSGSGGQGSD